jgi:nucleoside phosphorylase
MTDVLIADDLPEWREYLYDALHVRSTLSCDVVTNADDAIKYVDKDSYKLLILNRKIRTYNETKKILDHILEKGLSVPVIIYSAHFPHVVSPISDIRGEQIDDVFRNYHDRYRNVVCFIDKTECSDENRDEIIDVVHKTISFRQKVSKRIDTEPLPLRPTLEGESRKSEMARDRKDIAIQVIISPELNSVLKQFHIDIVKDCEPIDGSLYYHAKIHSNIYDRDLSIIVYCQSEQGNSPSAAAAQRIIDIWRPKCIFLLGISAGIRGKIKIGDVVIPRIVFSDILGVVRGGKRLPRMGADNLDYVMTQILRPYECDTERWHSALHDAIRQPNPESGKEDEYRLHFALYPTMFESNMYSSNSLLRDRRVIQKVKKEINEQIRIGEMEAGGFIQTCRSRSKTVPWCIVRGVADFGDDFKSDEFQRWAAHSATSYLKLLIEDGLRVDHIE